MSLESKAKTFREVKQEMIQQQQALIDAAQEIDDTVERKKAVQKAWKNGCSLEDVRNLLLLEEVQKIEAKIANANKILEKLDTMWKSNEEVTVPTYERYLLLLRETLKNE